MTHTLYVMAVADIEGPTQITLVLRCKECGKAIAKTTESRFYLEDIHAARQVHETVKSARTGCLTFTP